eukprot:CAMPEP_0203979762 /NCGR_PEP_ID=MMETSP0360-20130528/927_1 /ASSEMBLY_ACC=CAM_ASM_000342 /TAXON_ID=268821 /ORGANISM="Scrippsiella Hangoei, Strain SHTV-5" /LENGTH=82 /DNA_ID=CAMNT_0050918089 /DNA_START=12 /DNA_END=258 /DNA_ORIENTATION=-
MASTNSSSVQFLIGHRSSAHSPIFSRFCSAVADNISRQLRGTSAFAASADGVPEVDQASVGHQDLASDPASEVAVWLLLPLV